MFKKLNISLTQIAQTMLWITLAVLLSALIYSSMTTRGDGQVTAVVYDINHLSDGNDLVTVEELRARLINAYKSDLVGTKIDGLEIDHIESLLDQEPFIVKSHAYVDRDNQLHIELQQRAPMFRIMDQYGNNYYLDEDGVRLPLSNNFSARVPVVTGDVPEYTAWDSTDHVLKQVHALILASRADVFLNAWLESIHIDGNQELVLHGNIGSFAVEFGQGVDIERKMNNLKKFLKVGGKRLAWHSIEAISVKYKGQVVTRQKSKV